MPTKSQVDVNSTSAKALLEKINEVIAEQIEACGEEDSVKAAIDLTQYRAFLETAGIELGTYRLV